MFPLNPLTFERKKGTRRNPKKGTECVPEKDRIGPRRDAYLGPSILPWEAETPERKRMRFGKGKKGAPNAKERERPAK